MIITPAPSKTEIMKILHLHMPKTAGSAINHHFINIIGEEQCRCFVHPSQAGLLQNIDFISGHFYLKNIIDHFPGRYVFTFLREPTSHLASQIRWLDHYNQPEYIEERAGFPDDIIENCKKIQQLSFDDPQSLDNFLSQYSNKSVGRIVNAQSEYLAFNNAPSHKLMPEDQASLAIENLSMLDFIGITECYEEHLELLGIELNLTHQIDRNIINKNPSLRVIKLNNSEIYSVMRKHCVADTILYEHVRQRWASGHPPCSGRGLLTCGP